MNRTLVIFGIAFSAFALSVSVFVFVSSGSEKTPEVQPYRVGDLIEYVGTDGEPHRSWIIQIVQGERGIHVFTESGQACNADMMAEWAAYRGWNLDRLRQLHPHCFPFNNRPLILGKKGR